MNKKWSQAAIIRAMEENMQFQMTHCFKKTPGVEVFFEKDAVFVLSQVQDDTFNYVIDAKFSQENALLRVQDITKIFKKREIPFSWWVGENDTPSNLGDLLLQEGLSFKEENIAMYLSLDSFHPSSPVKELTFKRVLSQKELEDFSKVIVKIGGSREAFEGIYSKIPSNLYTEDDFQLHIGYIADTPVISGMLILHAGIAGIYYVATIPEERKKGFGTAMMEHLLKEAKRFQYEIATLQASSEGKALYERLGFSSCGSFKEYSFHGMRV